MGSAPYELALALRYLRPKRTFVSVITLICVAGVTLGVAVLIIVISVMTGFDRQFRDRIIGFSAHVKVERRNGPIEDWRNLMGKIRHRPDVAAVAPYINAQALVRTQPDRGEAPRTFGVLVRGVDPALEGKLVMTRGRAITNLVIEGTFRLTPGNVLLGYDLADAFSIRPDARLALYSPAAFEKLEASLKRARSKAGEIDEAPLPDDFRVAGLADLGLNDFNAHVMLACLGDAQDLVGFGDAVQGLSVMLKDASPEATMRVMGEIEADLGPEYALGSWLTDNRDFLHALATERAMMFYLLFFIVIVAAFGIMSALITFVVQKTREIGVLKALGASPSSIASLFFCQSLIVGVIGVITGVGLGLFLLAYRNPFLRFMSEKVGFNLFPPSIYQFRELPARTVTSDVVVICAGSLVICLLAGVLPAIRAAWLAPVEALRNE
jgi:lipoprotein-releasing system permease protein